MTGSSWNWGERVTLLADLAEFVHEHRPHGTLTADATQPARNGYLLIPGLFDAEETELLRKISKADQEKAAQTHEVLDAKAGLRLALMEMKETEMRK